MFQSLDGRRATAAAPGLGEMSAAAQQRMKIANEKAMKNVTHRGNVPKGNKVDQEKYPVRF